MGWLTQEQPIWITCICCIAGWIIADIARAVWRHHRGSK